MTDQKLSSIVSEHTTEFVLVPKITKILRAEYSMVVPLYFWLSREGGRRAKEIHEGQEFRVVALFPRRPKCTGESDSRIYFTVNEGLKDSAQLLLKRGVSCIAGCPLIKSFWQIDAGPQCIFIALDGNAPGQYSFDVENAPMDEHGTILASYSQLLRYVSESTRCLKFDELLIALRESRSLQGPQHIDGTHMFSSLYKPVILLLRQ